MNRNFNDMKETELKELLKEAFEAGRDYQYSINPYSGKPSMFNDKPSFTKWYNAKLKLLVIPDVVKSLPQDNYCEVCKLPTDGEKCYSKRCPI